MSACTTLLIYMYVAILTPGRFAGARLSPVVSVATRFGLDAESDSCSEGYL